MLSLSNETTGLCLPFTHVGTDLVLREKAGMETRRTPRIMNVGAVLYDCFNTKGVKVLLTRGYSMEDLPLSLNKIAANYSQPQSIHCNRGSNLVAGAKTVRDDGSGLRELPKAERAKFKGHTKKMIRVPVQRLVLIVPVEEQDGDVYGLNPNDAKNRASEDRKRKKKKGPGYPVHSTIVPETTLEDASVTYEQTVSHETTNEDLKANNFKDSLTKIFDTERPGQPLQLTYKTKSKAGSYRLRVLVQVKLEKTAWCTLCTSPTPC